MTGSTADMFEFAAVLAVVWVESTVVVPCADHWPSHGLPGTSGLCQVEERLQESSGQQRVKHAGYVCA